MNTELKPCPFCGGTPELPDEVGTQYEIECGDCGQAVASVQIVDYMTMEERASATFENCMYEAQFIDRAKKEAISRWNGRAEPAVVQQPAPPDLAELVEVLKRAKWMIERDHIDDQKMRVIKQCQAAIAKHGGNHD
jgi:hypothetical protein